MHKSLVFLSCGQREGERELAKDVENMITQDLKMDCYNADSVHGFDDVMSITEKLAIADYYIMIDFARDDGLPLSVFTHQEFALARAWGLDRMLVFQEEPLVSHGMLAYVLAHPIKFTRDNLVDIVRQAICDQKWEKTYSRNLLASEITPLRELVTYGDHAGQHSEQIWHLTVQNNRTDRAAINTIGILDLIHNCRTGEDIDSPDRSYLKWAYQKDGYLHTILPRDHAMLDAFAIRMNEAGVFLHSRRDYYPNRPIITDPGEYIFTYNVYSANFPLLRVPVRVNYGEPIKVISTLIDTATQATLNVQCSKHTKHEEG